MVHRLPGTAPRGRWAAGRVLACGLELVTALAGRDEAVWSRCGEVRVAAVAGIGEHDTDRVLLSSGLLIQPLRGGLRGGDHGRESGHVVRGLADLDCGDHLVARDGYLGVVALEESSPGRHQPR